ncbi:MAG: hypothetical protein ACT4OE_03620 [Sphingosinicella sp.]
MRLVLGLVIGFVVGFLVIAGIEYAGYTLYPPPPDIDLNDPVDLERLISIMPPAALAFVVAAWFFGTLVGGWIGNLIARRALAGWIIALVTVLFGIYTMMTIPHPVWMWGVGVLLPLVAAWLAQKLSRQPL